MRPHPTALLASALVALESVVVFVLAVVQVFAIISGDVAEMPSAIALLVLTIVMGAGVLAFAWGILRGETWGRSGGIVTQVLIFAIGMGAMTGIYAHPMTGLAIMVPAIVTFVLIIAATRRNPDIHQVPEE